MSLRACPGLVFYIVASPEHVLGSCTQPKTVDIDSTSSDFRGCTVHLNDDVTGTDERAIESWTKIVPVPMLYLQGCKCRTVSSINVNDTGL